MNFNNYSGSIVHHAVKGQRWGVRRYQNEDGSLTEAGKKKAEKAEIRSDAKKLAKAGIPGDWKDRIHKNRGTELYSKINQERGREYTNKVLRSAKMRTYAQAAAVSSIGAGVAVVASLGIVKLGTKAYINKLS